MSRASDISDAAARWLVRLEGQTTPQIWDAFQEWMDQDPRHRAAFIRLRVAWNHVDLLKNMRPVDGTIDADLLATTKTPSKDQIKTAMNGHLCRCGTYTAIIEAIQIAAKEMAQGA